MTHDSCPPETAADNTASCCCGSGAVKEFPDRQRVLSKALSEGWVSHGAVRGAVGGGGGDSQGCGVVRGVGCYLTSVVQKRVLSKLACTACPKSARSQLSEEDGLFERAVFELSHDWHLTKAQPWLRVQLVTLRHRRKGTYAQLACYALIEMPSQKDASGIRPSWCTCRQAAKRLDNRLMSLRIESASQDSGVFGLKSFAI